MISQGAELRSRPDNRNGRRCDENQNEEIVYEPNFHDRSPKDLGGLTDYLAELIAQDYLETLGLSPEKGL